MKVKNSFSLILILKLLFLIFSPLLFINCFPAKSLKVPKKEKTPEEVLVQLVEQEEKAKTVSCLLNFEIKGKEKLKGDLELFFREPEEYAFYSHSFWGSTILQGSIKNDSVWLYFPTKDQYYLDSYENFSQTKFWKWKIELKKILDLAVGKNGIKSQAQLIEKNEKEWIFSQTEDEFYKEFWVNNKDYALEKLVWVYSENSETLLVFYKKYTFFGKFTWPSVIEAKLLPVNEKAKIKFDVVLVNVDIPSKKFEIKIPSQAKRVEIK